MDVVIMVNRLWIEVLERAIWASASRPVEGIHVAEPFALEQIDVATRDLLEEIRSEVYILRAMGTVNGVLKPENVPWLVRDDCTVVFGDV